MKLRILLIMALAASVASCGIKNDLLLPNGKDNPKGQKDPSKPPQPIGK